MMHDSFSTISIPKDWTGEQANAVFDFLEDILTAIWETHETALIEILLKNRELDNCDNDLDLIPIDDGIPF